MNKRETELEIIQIEFTKHGKETTTSMGAGLDIYRANAPRVEQFDGVVVRAKEAMR